MRWSLIVPMLVLIVGVGPAPAQESMRPGNPNPVTSVEKHPAAKRHAPRRKVRHRVRHPAPTRHTTATASPKIKVPLPPPAPSPVTETAIASSTASEGVAGIPPTERRKIQSALLWAGDFPDAKSGEDPLIAAVRNFQKRHKDKVTGVLTDEQRADLLAAANRYRTEFGWSVVVDPATGIRIGLPTKLMPNAHDAARGTRWSSAHNEVSVETFRIKDSDLKLADLYAQEKKHPPKRELSRAVLRDNDFFISGMQGLKYFSVRAQQRDGEVRGFTMLYDQAWEGIVAPVMVAMASAFSPFPERTAPFAALARSVEYGTGLIVSPQGHIVTTSKAADGCQVIVAAGIGNVERLAEDRDNGLTLLRVYGQRNLAALALKHDTATAGKIADDTTGATPVDLTLIGIPDPKGQHGADEPREIKARLFGQSEIRLRQPVPVAGFSGAAALDAQGRFVGMMETRNFVVASAEPTAPPVRLVDVATIRRFLTTHHVQPAERSGDARKAVVRVICVRK